MEAGYSTGPVSLRMDPLCNLFLSYQGHLPSSFPGLFCVHQWLGCFSWPLGLSLSSSSSGGDGNGENMGPCGCPLASFEGLGHSRHPTGGGPH